MKGKPIRGRGFGGGLRYTFRVGQKAKHSEKAPRIVGGNMAGRTAEELTREFGAVRRLRSAIEQPVWHCPLSLTKGETITDETWGRFTRDLMIEMQFNPDIFPYVSILHDEKYQHSHLWASRIGIDGSVWHGKWEAFKVIEACQRLEKKYGLVLTAGLHGKDDEAGKANRRPRVADAQSILNANKVKGTRKVDTAECARVLLECATRSSDLPTFTTAALAAGIAVKPNRSDTTGHISGLSVIPPGRKKFLTLGDATGKKLTWPKLLKIFDQNDQAADAARVAARVVVDAADRNAAERVAARLDKQPQPAPVSQPARALTPEASSKAKEAVMTDTTLDFLNPPPPPRPSGMPLDDTGLSMPSAASADGEARHKKKLKTEQEERDRDQAELAMLAEVRKLSVKQLLDLRSNVPPFVLSVAAIERLVNLMIRLLSLFFVKRVDKLSDALAARQRLQELAADELDRRRRSPRTVAERKAALDEYHGAVKERSLALGNRQSVRKNAEPYRDRTAEAVTLRAQFEDALERRQAARGHDTIAARRAAYHAAALAQRAARDLVPAGLAGLLITRAARDAAAAAKAAAAVSLKQAAERRAAAKQQLQLLLDEVEADAIAHQQETEEKAAAIKKAETVEVDALARELRALPDELRQVGTAAERVRHQQHAVELVAEFNRPKTAAELAAAEAERLRLLALTNRRG